MLKPKLNTKKSLHKWWQNWVNWLYILIGILLFFPLFRYIKKQLELNTEQNALLNKDASFSQNSNVLTQTQKADKITKRKDIQSAANQIAIYLGTRYSDKNAWYSFIDPRGWTEEDTKVADLVIKQRLNYSLLKRLYFECYSNSRNLSDDLISLLDPDQLARVQKYINI